MEIYNEAFELLPINLKYEGSVLGHKLYSNNSIKEYIFNTLEKSPFTNKISTSIKEGINSGTILVGYMEPRFFKNVVSKIKNWIIPEKDYLVVGFYSNLEQKIGIVLDQTSYKKKKMEKFIPKTLLHEMTHFVFDLKPRIFIRKHSKIITNFYKELILEVNPDININEKYLSELLVELGETETNKGVNNRNTFYVETIWRKFFSKHNLNIKEADELTEKLFLPLHTYIIEDVSESQESKNMLIHFLNAYKKIGIDVKNVTVPGQEVRTPSEIIAIKNEFKISNGLISLIKNINFKSIGV